MLGKFKELFGGKKKDSAAPKAAPVTAANLAPVKKPRASRVNLDRRFSIISEIGQGSMSKVYRALDKKTSQSVCLKVQIPEKNSAAAARAVQQQRPDEGEVGLRISNPHVVRTFEHGMSTRGEHFVSMEYIDGQSIRFLRETRSVPKLAEKLELLAQAAEGLAAVHAAGFIHHDIGPHNFLVTREPRVKLIDFGLSIPNTPVFCRPGNRTGTLNYMAPELVRRETIDERIDIFAFGAMSFEFLTDRLPYDATNSMASMIARINVEPLDPALANPALPVELHDLLRKLISRRREGRWSKMATLPDALREIPTQGR